MYTTELIYIYVLNCRSCGLPLFLYNINFESIKSISLYYNILSYLPILKYLLLLHMRATSRALLVSIFWNVIPSNNVVAAWFLTCTRLGQWLFRRCLPGVGLSDCGHHFLLHILSVFLLSLAMKSSKLFVKL